MLRFCVIAIPILFLAQGCKPAAETKYPVSGSVMLDGTPIADGQIYFMDKATGMLATALPIQNGNYQGDVQAGPLRVEIHAYREEGTHVPMPGMDPEPLRVDYIPPKFGTESELSAEIAPGDNKFDFDLKSNG